MEKNRILFTSESVSEGHPDKVADLISDAIVDAYLAGDPESRIASECLVTTNTVVVAGEVTSKCIVDVDNIVRNTISEIGYCRPEYLFDAKTVNIQNLLHEQSDDIIMGVDRGDKKEMGAGDQGIMFGYAVKESENFMPLTLEIANILLKTLADIRKDGRYMPYLRPDSKSQVTIEYDENWKPLRIDTILISTQHDEPEEYLMSLDPEDGKTRTEFMHEIIENDVRNLLIPCAIDHMTDDVKELFNHDFKLIVNPTGNFVIGGPHGDTGLTGRKIVVDNYGGRCAVGGGAFSSKCPTKVDRSAAYMARYVAKNIVAAGIADETTIQISYAIGQKSPISVYVNTHGKSKLSISDFELSKKIAELFDLTPYGIITKLNLEHPIYKETAAYGHFGRTPFERDGLEFFTWEKLDSVDMLKTVFKIK